MDEATINNLLYPLLIISQPTLFAIVLVISVSLVGSYYYRIKTSSCNAKRLPPGSLGLPFFGESISFFRAQKCDKTQEWIQSRIERHGSIFKTSLMGKPTVVLTGSTGNRFLFTANENTVATNQPVTVSSILGKSNTFELGEHDHKLIRGAMSSFLKPESLQRCVGEMDAVIKDQIFQEFNMRDSVKAVPLMKRITFNVTCSVLFGLPKGKELDSLFEDFTIALKGVWSLQLNFPLTSFHQAMAARKRICTYFSALVHEIKERLADGNKYTSNENTVITKFLNLRGMDGETLPDDMVIDNIVTLMFASHDTSTTLLIHLIRHLARDKSIYKSVLEEQVRVLGEKKAGEGKLTWDDIQKMKFTWRVAQEMMRITPPVFGNFKRAASVSINIKHQRAVLLDSIKDLALAGGEDDLLSWRWNKVGVFTVKSFYEFLNTGGCWSGVAKYIWSTTAPYRVKAFLWLVGKEAILTWDNLNIRGWMGPSMCCLCGKDAETVVHIFISCDFTRHIWKAIDQRMLHIGGLSVADIWHEKLYADKDSRSLQLTSVAAVLWNIWKERNNRIFNNTFSSVDSCILHIHDDFSFWSGLSHIGTSSSPSGDSSVTRRITL